MTIPSYDDLFNPVIKAMHDLGGSASNREIEQTVIKILSLSEKQVSLIHRGSRTVLDYRLAWTRNYLKNFGVLENSKRGIWALTEKGLNTTKADKKEINKYVKELSKNKEKVREKSSDANNEEWQGQYLEKLLNIDPSAFERFCQRLLREAGFVEVTVTKKTGDGGIDGHGIIKIGDLVSFPIMFQSKRYKGSVSPSIVRDFRGAMVGRFSKGLIITTGTFTRSAREEASRDGAPNIDLIDGDELVSLAKKFELGMRVIKIENVQIIDDWFKSI